MPIQARLTASKKKRRHRTTIPGILLREMDVHSPVEGLPSRIDVAVYDWMRGSGGSVQGLRLDAAPEELHMDELHIIIVSKIYHRIWIAVDRNGKGFGHRLFATTKKQVGDSWDAFQDKNIGCAVRAVSGILMDNSNRKGLFKTKTYKAEGFDCLVRRFLMRLGRKMKRHSNSNIVHQYPVFLLMLKWNNRLKKYCFFPLILTKVYFMKLKTIDLSLLTLIIAFAISSVHAEKVQLAFPMPLRDSINCEDKPNGISCIELESNVSGENQEIAPIATDFEALSEIQEGTPLPEEMLTDTLREARCVSNGGSTAVTGVGGFCVASDLRTSATDLADFAVANDEVPVTGLQFLQVTMRNGSTLVGSRELLDTDAPMGAVCASVGGSTAATEDTGGFCMASDLSSDSPAATFSVANDLPVAAMHFLQVTFRGPGQVGEALVSANGDAGAKCVSVNGSTATSGNAGGFCMASDLSTSALGVANFSVANELPAAEMHFIQVTFGDGGALDEPSPGSEAPTGVECVAVGGSTAATGDAGVSCVASDLSASIKGDANYSLANDLPIASMQFLQAVFGGGNQPVGSPGIAGLAGECVSAEGSTASTSNTEGSCLVSDRVTSTTAFANYSLANGLPISALHYQQVPYGDDNQLDPLGLLPDEGAPMGVVISDSARTRLLRRFLPVLEGVPGNDNRYFRILRGRSGIDIQSSPNQGRRLRPAFWRSR